MRRLRQKTVGPSLSAKPIELAVRWPGLALCIIWMSPRPSLIRLREPLVLKPRDALVFRYRCTLIRSYTESSGLPLVGQFGGQILRNSMISMLVLFLTATSPGPGSLPPPADNWLVVPTEAYPKKRDDIIFVDRQNGYYGTGKGRLFKTVDGGASWNLAWERKGTFIRALGFVDGATGFLGNLGTGFPNVTDPNPLYRTSDGGRTWSPVDIGSAPVAGICVIDILKSSVILEGDVRERVIIHAAGRANGPAQLLRSEDGGQSWIYIDLSGRAGMILDVKFITPQTGFVFAGTDSDVSKSSALILKTTDGGRTWREVYRSSRPMEIIWKASFADSKTAFATIQNDNKANEQQRILKTADGGSHWSELPLVADPEAQEFGVGFISPKHGWVGTATGGFETRDGGLSWQKSNLAHHANKIRTRASDGSPLVYAIGSEIQILKQIE
jgi:photosystem II stability/assembly factor-like uncharacterized protein